MIETEVMVMPNTPQPNTPSSVNPTPLPQYQFTSADLADPQQFVAKLNDILNNHGQVLNQQQGFGGPIVANNHMDMNGYRLMNVGQPQSATDALPVSTAHANYSAEALKAKFESGGSSALTTYRQMNSPFQREQSSSFLNDLASTAPTANTSTISAGSVSGGFQSVTVSSGVLSRTDKTIVAYPSLTASLPVPGSGVAVHYVHIQAGSTELFLYPTSFPVDNWANRIAASTDGVTIVAVITMNTSGYDSANSASGGTDPSTNSSAPTRLFGRL